MLQTRAYENHVYYIFTNAHQTLFISEEGLIEAMGSEGTVTYHSGDSSFRRRGPESKNPCGVLPAVSSPWVPAWGSLGPPRRDGENAHKTGENGEKWARYGLKCVKEPGSPGMTRPRPVCWPPAVPCEQAGV